MVIWYDDILWKWKLPGKSAQKTACATTVQWGCACVVVGRSIAILTMMMIIIIIVNIRRWVVGINFALSCSKRIFPFQSQFEIWYDAVSELLLYSLFCALRVCARRCSIVSTYNPPTYIYIICVLYRLIIQRRWAKTTGV